MKHPVACFLVMLALITAPYGIHAATLAHVSWPVSRDIWDLWQRCLEIIWSM